jgi:aspartate kinase
MLKVAKFGGSSMADAGQYEKVRSIVRADPARRVVVVSAAGKRSSDGPQDNRPSVSVLRPSPVRRGLSGRFDMIADRYRGICSDLSLKVDIEGELSRFRDKLKPGVSQDWLVSRGEYFSALLMADYLGYDFLDSELWLRFNFDGSIDRAASYEALSQLAADRSVVIPGFYGVMPDGRVKVMTRGGSDITGALAAAALDADVYENWTDVSGILMADPRIVKNPDTISRITYSELRELSYMGAQVLHEASIFPVRDKHIPLNIRNTNAPDDPGTLIMESFDEELPSEKNRLITGIAGRRDFTIVTVAKSGLSSSVGALRQILEIFEKHDVCVEYTPSGIDSVSLVVSTAKTAGCIYSIVGEIEKTLQPDSIDLTDGISVVAAVGRKMAYQPGSSGALFAALGQNGINIRMITQGPEELNIIVGVNNADFEKTVRVIYDSFVK